MPELFGRTNVRFPAVWLSPRLPSESHDIVTLGAALANSETVVDVSGQTALWGSFMRASTNPVMVIGPEDAGRAVSESHAADLTDAHLLQVLSSIGRSVLDFYFLPIRRAWEEYQLAGVFAALEEARKEGHLRYVGLAAEGSPLAALGVWQFHDAFECLLVADNDSLNQLQPLARERRVGILGRDMDTDARLETVNSADQIERIMGVVSR